MSDKTLGEVVEVFLLEYKATTRRTYGRDLGMMMRYISPAILLEEITPFDVIRAVQTYERRDTVKSVHTVNKFIKTVHRFFNWCVQIQLLDKSPASSVDYRMVSDESAEEKAMPQKDFEKIVGYFEKLAELKKHKYRALALFLFLYDTGARRAGVAGLRWRDIRFDKGNGLAKVTEKGELTREVWFGALATSALRQWKLIQKQKSEVDDYVFNHSGIPISPPALGQYFARCCKEAGVQAYRPHSLRHRFGFRMEENNVPDHVAAEALGHRNVNTYRKHYVRKDRTLAKRATLDLSYRTSDKLKTKITPFNSEKKAEGE